jgi:hypothetical protein
MTSKGKQRRRWEDDPVEKLKRRAARRVPFILVAALVGCLLVPHPASGWSNGVNGPDSFGTHDWILQLAIEDEAPRRRQARRWPAQAPALRANRLMVPNQREAEDLQGRPPLHVRHARKVGRARPCLREQRPSRHRRSREWPTQGPRRGAAATWRGQPSAASHRLRPSRAASRGARHGRCNLE